jgi:hypothetical protein
MLRRIKLIFRGEMMKIQLFIVGLILSVVIIAGCAQQPGQIVGGDKDIHGCIGSAGYSWCEAKQKCLRVWEENCTKECGTCPLLSQPAPGWCAGGTIVSGEKNECGCQSPPKCVRACTEEAKICPDGSAVGRNGENNCEFDPCPGIVGNDSDEHGCKASAGYSWCDEKQKCIRSWEEDCSGVIGGNTGMPNPAATFCVAQGGESKIVTAADGSQSGVCALPYGVECDEWAYFRGECPVSVTCTAEQKAAEMCTLEYMPVCGDDGVTYGNKCSACASKAIDSYKPGECPTKTYITRDPEQCKVIKYLCIKGKEPFSDDYGCGCKPVEEQTTCGNGICDPGEASQCPACYYSTPPCLAPCTAGTCPEDCTTTEGKLKANDCTEPRTQACTKEYMPVCGWFDFSIRCVKYPCATTYSNKCTACADSKVAYWTEGECPE